MTLVNAFGDIALDQSVQDVKGLLQTGARANPENITTKFREAFESFTPGVKWTLSQGSGDIVQIDGNAAGSSYLVISKDPLNSSNVTTLETIDTFDMPIESAVGLGMSQRVLGQELSMELVSNETPLTPMSDIPILNISQSTTTLTINTSVPHNLVPGMKIGIYGVSDSRLNYPSLVVLAIPTSTQFLCTSGPSGTIPSITAGPYTNGYIYYRSSLGSAPNGISQIFENATATNASLYQRSSAGDVFPSGSVLGNHSITVATTTGSQVSAAFTYAWYPASEYRLNLQADRAIYYDVGIDSTGLTTGRLLRTQVIPDSSKQYKMRFRFTNQKGLTVPTAKIVSAQKSGSTTATIVTDAPHGLSATDYIVIYGIRDQTNFANLTTATAVASVVNSTTFTIAFGASATTISYGGMVARIQGGNIPGSFTTIAVQSAANDGSYLTLVGSGNWSWLIGDYVNVYGVKDNNTGASMNIDGVYKVANVSTTTLVLAPIGGTTLPATFTTTNCGGTVIRRTDVRISFVRIFDYLRERVEILAQPTIAGSTPVAVTNTPAVTVSGTVTSNQGTAAAPASPWPVTIQSINGPDLYYQSVNAFSYIRSRITVT